MPQATGANAQLIYQAETTFKTDPVTPDCTKMYILSLSGGAKRELNRTKIIRGSRNPVKPSRGKKTIEFSCNTELNPYMGTILKHLIGSNTTTGTSPYTHTMKIGALPVGLLMEVGYTDIGKYMKHNGCKVNKGHFEFNPDGSIPFSIDILGAKRTKGATSFDSTPIDLGHTPFDGFEATIEEGGSAIAYVKKVEFDIENDLDGDNYVVGGAGERRAIPEGSTAVAGKLTALFESDALLDKAINFTESSLKIVLTKGTGVGSAGNEYCEFLIPELYFEEQDPGIPGPKGILIELPFISFYDNAAEASAFQLILKNTQATI